MISLPTEHTSKVPAEHTTPHTTTLHTAPSKHQAHLPRTPHSTASTYFVTISSVSETPAPAPASCVAAPAPGSSPAEALVVEAAAASSAATTSAAGTAASPAPVVDDDGAPSPTTGAMDRFVVPYVPGSDEAAQMFIATNKGAASAFGRQRQSVVRKSPETAGATSGDGQKTKRSRGVNAISASNPKTISAASRVAEFPDERFVVSLGKLFCEPCGIRLATRRSTIINHAGLKPNGSHRDKPNKHMRQMVIWNADRVVAPARMERFTEYCQKQVCGSGLLPEVNDVRCKVRFFFLALHLVYCTRYLVVGSAVGFALGTYEYSR